MARHRETGASHLGTVVWLLIAVALILIAKEAIPVKIRTSQLQDYMIELAKFSTRQTDEVLQKRILEKAQELQLPLEKDAVSVRISNGRVRMRAQYTIPLEFPFYTYVWNFDHQVDRPVFII